jgi:transposase
VQQYSENFKARMVERLVGERAISANALSQEVGISQATLSRWLREAGSVATVSKKDDAKPRTKRPEDWSPQEKLEAVLESASIPETELGVWLRRKGLKEEHLRQWRELALSGIAARPSPTRPSSEERRRLEKLEKELKRKDKALAETAALLVLQGKMQALWAEEDDATRPGSDETSSQPSRKRRPPERG